VRVRNPSMGRLDRSGKPFGWLLVVMERRLSAQRLRCLRELPEQTRQAMTGQLRPFHNRRGCDKNPAAIREFVGLK
jgi:hypothetical protein